jgi:O-antigen ligase
LLGLVVGIAVAGIVLKVGPGWTYRGLWGPALIVLYAAILLAGRSRIVTVIAILLVGVAILAAMRRSHIAAGIGWLGAAGLLAALFVVLQLPGTQETIVQFALRDEDANSLRTLTGRTAIWDFALLAWQQSPWVGYGYYAGHRLALPTMFTIFSGYSNLDSTWIETLVNSGYLGTVPLAVFAAAGLVRVLRHPWGTPERWIAWGVAAATVGLSFINPGIQSTTSTMVLFAVVVAGSRQELSKQASVPTIIPAEVNAARGRAEGNSGQTELAT